MVRSRLRQIERHAEDFYTLVTCPECGLEVRASGDLALQVLAASWSDEAGQHRPPDQAVDMVLSHPHDALREELFGSFYGVGHA